MASAQRRRSKTTVTLAWCGCWSQLDSKTYLKHLLSWKREMKSSTPRLTVCKAVFCALLMGCHGVFAASYLSPTALAASKDGRTLYVACATASRVLVFDTTTREVSASIPLPQSPSGLTLSSDETRLFVTCTAPESRVCVVDLGKLAVETIPVGHTAMAPVLSPDGKTLYVCNRFNHEVSMIDLASRKELRRIPVQREPVAADITRDGKFLLVANHLPLGRADVADVAAVVSVIDTTQGQVVKELRLSNGSEGLQVIRVSPDGNYAIVSHILAQFKQSTGHIYRGWMNRNAVTIIELGPMQIYNTMLLDLPDKGAANPWGLAWATNSAAFVATQAGTHELGVVDFAKVRFQLPRLHPASSAITQTNAPSSERFASTKELPLQIGGRKHLKLAAGDLGPRAVVMVGATAYIANFFSDTLSIVDLNATGSGVKSIPLGPKRELDPVRRGELYFHDARICFQGWQSCSSCHPGDARVDGLNWDLLNDGRNNPKNTKSLLLAHQTPPAMSLGVRDTAKTAVRAGIRHILFTQQPEEVSVAMDAYLQSLKPVPSPYLVSGQLAPAARRGETVFRRAGCAECHPPGMFTDLKQYDVGARNPSDQETDRFDTPTLIEVWRTAPYLHDGSAATLRDVLTTLNHGEQHGKTSNLSRQEIDDLCAYVLSL